jgi:hypothetical protein
MVFDARSGKAQLEFKVTDVYGIVKMIVWRTQSRCPRCERRRTVNRVMMIVTMSGSRKGEATASQEVLRKQ